MSFLLERCSYAKNHESYASVCWNFNARISNSFKLSDRNGCTDVTVASKINSLHGVNFSLSLNLFSWKAAIDYFVQRRFIK